MKLGNAKVISFINLKGGVGKTTAAVNVAATIAKSWVVKQGKPQKQARVLLIDLDPQSNASLTLLKPDDYDPKRTIVNLFKYELKRDDSEESFDLTEVRYETPIEGLNLDLIPSGLDLFDIQDELVKYQRYYLSATDILFNALNKLRESKERAYTHIIIDCPPAADSQVPQSALLVADLVLVPIIPSPLDMWAAVGIKQVIANVSEINDTLQSRLLLNQCQPRTTLAQEAQKILPAFGIETATNKLCHRQVYRQAAVFGKTVHDFGHKAEAAITEINALADEVFEILGGKTPTMQHTVHTV